MLWKALHSLPRLTFLSAALGSTALTCGGPDPVCSNTFPEPLRVWDSFRHGATILIIRVVFPVKWSASIHVLGFTFP